MLCGELVVQITFDFGISVGLSDKLFHRELSVPGTVDNADLGIKECFLLASDQLRDKFGVDIIVCVQVIVT